MAIVNVPAFPWPRDYGGGNNSPTQFQNSVLNASGAKAGFVFRAPKTGNIRRIGLRLGTITTPTDTDMRLEGVSAQFPSGTLYGTNTNATISSGSLAANVMNMVTLTADAVVTVNDLLAVVAVPTGSPNYPIAHGNWSSSYSQLPYTVSHNGSAWGIVTNQAVGSVEYSDGTYALIDAVLPITVANAHTFNSGSTPDEIGMRFRFPVSIRVTGGWVAIDIDNTTQIVLYDSDGATPLLTSSSMTSDGRVSTGGRSPYFFRFPSQAILAANTWYYYTVKPGASNIVTYSWDVLSAAALDQMPCGQDCHYISAKDPSGTGSWTPILTRYPVMGLLIDGVDDGAAAKPNIFDSSIIRAVPQ